MVLALWAVNFAFLLPIFSVSRLLMLFRYFPISLSVTSAMFHLKCKDLHARFSPLAPFIIPRVPPVSISLFAMFSCVLPTALSHSLSCFCSPALYVLTSLRSIILFRYFPSLPSDIMHSLAGISQTAARHQTSRWFLVSSPSFALRCFLFLGALTCARPPRESQFKCYILIPSASLSDDAIDIRHLLIADYSSSLIFSFIRFVTSLIRSQHRNAQTVLRLIFCHWQMMMYYSTMNGGATTASLSEQLQSQV